MSRHSIQSAVCAVVLLLAAVGLWPHRALALGTGDAIYPAVVTGVTDAEPGDVAAEEGVELDFFLQKTNLTVHTPSGDRQMTIDNDFMPLAVGDEVFVRVAADAEGEVVTVYDMDRRWSLGLLVGLFAAAVALFGGVSGLRSLLALALSVMVIFYILMPLLASGRSPVVWGGFVAVGLLALAMLVTHGARRTTLAAFLGTAFAVVVTGALTSVIMGMARFTGVGTEEAFFLSNAVPGIDMVRLLFAGVLIGMVGVLDDVAITQASVVAELRRAGVAGWETYRRAMVVGREHVGALINTLVLAYAGASLPMLLLLSTYREPLGAVVSIEMVAAEIVRSLAGSIGLIIAVPATTAIAVWLLRDPAHVPPAHGHTHAH